MEDLNPQYLLIYFMLWSMAEDMWWSMYVLINVCTIYGLGTNPDKFYRVPNKK